jgi:flavorubredoxin
MVSSYQASKDIDVLTTNVAIPGLGLVPVNAFLIKGSEPLLVDTGTVAESNEFMSALRSAIDPGHLKWIWLTHTDFDHIGTLHELLGENPDLRVITTFLGVGIMGLSTALPMERIQLVNPGENITIGDRKLTAVKPPVFDNPCTTGFYDHSSDVLFSSDCFGALLSEVPESAAEIPEEDLREGQVFWATVDSPWLHTVDQEAFAKRLDEVRKMNPTMILSSHLPAATGDMTERLLSSLAAAPTAQPFVGPNQAGLEQMLKEMTAASQ